MCRSSLQLLAQASGNFVSSLLIRLMRHFRRINTEKIVTAFSWMNVDVQVWHFLKRRFAN